MWAQFFFPTCVFVQYWEMLLSIYILYNCHNKALYLHFCSFFYFRHNYACFFSGKLLYIESKDCSGMEETDGTRLHHGKKASQWMQCQIKVLHIMYHLPKQCCRPNTFRKTELLDKVIPYNLLDLNDLLLPPSGASYKTVRPVLAAEGEPT